jgi:hypothetical protein
MAIYSAAPVLFLLCALRLAGADLLLTPENFAIVGGVGQTVHLRCSSSIPVPQARMIWSEYITNNQGAIISDARNIVPTHPNAARYSVVGSDAANEFFLEIRDVVFADGGRYMCQDVNSFPPAVFRGFAELIVLATEPQCSSYATGSGIVMEGGLYSSECNVNYRGNIAPNFEWFGPAGYFTQNGTRPPNSVWSWMYFTAVRELETQSFSHRTNFTEVFAEPEHATNIPDYTHQHFGPQLVIAWPPNVITITPIKPTYEVGDVILCQPDSKPPSNVQWQNMRTLDLAPPGDLFVVTAELLGTEQPMRCTASVLIDGSFYTNNAFVDVSVPLPTTTPPTTIPPPTTPPPADGPCRNPTGRWQSTSPPAQMCFEVDSKGNIYVIIRNATDLYFVPGRGKTVYNDYSHLGFTAHWPNTGVAAFVGECHSCFGNEVLLFSGLSRNKHSHDVCGESSGTQLTPLYVFTRIGPVCVGMEVDEVRTNQPWIVERMGVKAKTITPI